MICVAATHQRRLALSVRAQQQATQKNPAAKQNFKTNVAKTAAAAFAAAVFTFSPFPSFAEIDTDTYKAGPSAKIEASNLQDQSPESIVNSLKEKVLPQAEEKLSKAADQSGGSYANSVLQELKTVRSELDALEQQLQEDNPPSESVVKSTASGIEQQLNALKALLGFT